MATEIIPTYFNTPIGNFIFDAYFNINHESNLSITEHPVQSGANVSDHAYMEPKIVTFEIGMSDVMHDILGKSIAKFDGNSSSRSVNAYKILRKLQENIFPIECITRLDNYSNMLIETISAPDDEKTTYGLRATVTLKELIVVNVTTVKISERPHKSEITNEGEQKVKKANESVLSSFLN